jgi:hypothetical protein
VNNLEYAKRKIQKYPLLPDHKSEVWMEHTMPRKNPRYIYLIEFDE